MAIAVQQIENKPVSSNCFVVHDKAVGCDCIIVDPGCRDCCDIIDYINHSELFPKYIILTHEHFDHCWGVNELVTKYQVPVICSALCAEKIQNAKKNCSIFYDNKQSFEIHCNTISVEFLNLFLDFNGHPITFYHTPGHTDASISFVVDKYLFTGDTLMYGVKTPAKLPTGSTQKLAQSLALYKTLPPTLTVLAGHGETFKLGEDKFWGNRRKSDGSAIRSNSTHN